MAPPNSLRAIGEGAVFTVYDLPHAPQIRGALKVGNYGAIMKDLRLGTALQRSLFDLLRSDRQDIPKIPAVPRYREHLSQEDPRWVVIEARFSVPLKCAVANAVVMEKIHPFGHGTPKLIVRKYFGSKDHEAVLSNGGPLTIRPYLGRQWTDDAIREHIGDTRLPIQLSAAGKPLFPRSTSLQGFPLFRDQFIEALNTIDRKKRRGPKDTLLSHIIALAATFAAMHWGSGIDGEGCEFLYGLKQNRATLWVLDFDRCGSFPPPRRATTRMVREQLVPAACTLSAYLPHPSSDRELWCAFAQAYLAYSFRMFVGLQALDHDRSSLLPHVFVGALRGALVGVGGPPIAEQVHFGSFPWPEPPNALSNGSFSELDAGDLLVGIEDRRYQDSTEDGDREEEEEDGEDDYEDDEYEYNEHDYDEDEESEEAEGGEGGRGWGSRG